jgi:hypothetical protein
VPKSVPGDLNNDQRVTTDDLNILQNLIGFSPTCPNDARDLNHDGKIDENDIEIMKKLITEQNEKSKLRDHNQQKTEGSRSNDY